MSTTNLVNNEYEGLCTTQFSPFDDAEEANRYQYAATFHQTGSGMDTSDFDKFRQGVELTLPKHLYSAAQAKIWTGNLQHQLNAVTYGQPRSWTEYLSTGSFDDMAVRFDSKQYITDPWNYPFPIYFNDGPQEAEEACIEPLDIPFKTTLLDSSNPAHTIKGSLESGNMLAGEEGTSIVTAFCDYSGSSVMRHFLDLGQNYFGPASSLVDCIIIEGYTPLVRRLNAPFNDIADEQIVEQVTSYTETASATFVGRLKELDMNIDEDLREKYGQRCMTAGWSVYGGDSARYGSDSIAYVGTRRGSTE